MSRRNTNKIGVRRVNILFTTRDTIFIRGTKILNARHHLRVRHQTFRIKRRRRHQPFQSNSANNRLPRQRNSNLFIINSNNFCPIGTLLILIHIIRLTIANNGSRLVIPGRQIHLRLFHRYSNAIRPIRRPRNILRFNARLQNKGQGLILNNRDVRGTICLNIILGTTTKLRLGRLIRIGNGFLHFTISLRTLLGFIPSSLKRLMNMRIRRKRINMKILLPQYTLPTPLNYLLINMNPIRSNVPNGLIIHRHLRKHTKRIRHRLTTSTIGNGINLMNIRTLVNFISSRRVPIRLNRITRLIMLTPRVL